LLRLDRSAGVKAPVEQAEVEFPAAELGPMVAARLDLGQAAPGYVSVLRFADPLLDGPRPVALLGTY
jgi:hypothetical protein